MPRHKTSLDPDTKHMLFRHPHKNKVNFNPYTKIKAISISHTDIKSISTTDTKKQVNFDPHTKTKSFLTRTQRLGKFQPTTQKLSHWFVT